MAVFSPSSVDPASPIKKGKNDEIKGRQVGVLLLPELMLAAARALAGPR